jgi:hypothetical protein
MARRQTREEIEQLLPRPVLFVEQPHAAVERLGTAISACESIHEPVTLPRASHGAILTARVWRIRFALPESALL